MRQNLIDLIRDTIIFQYDLPNDSVGILKSIFSTHNDKCYKATAHDKVSEIIYNSIVDYSINEFEMSGKDLDNLHAIALKNKLKYNLLADEDTKLKYGFYGEVLLYSILLVFFGAKPLIARGYFYNPLENAETKGYDSYQLVEYEGSLELWFGEVKFHISHSSGIKSVLQNIERALSDIYLETNVFAIQNHRNNFNVKGSLVDKVLDSWESNPNIQLSEEIKKHGMTLVYPILILYEQDNSDFDTNIRKIPDYILKNHPLKKFNLSIPYKVFFILLPLEKVKQIKENVIQWIESKRPLIS